ncbi:adenylate kinase isoenzyme 5-like, partial [Centroberyx affinis]|uniref:adenylate kinase isoenzyme 5-like n=1 Tax=Centroberyx affinis TaxID=166261 RepID=UPI003A5BA16B
SLLTGLLYHRPEDPVGFLQLCLSKTRQLGGPEGVAWDTFLHPDRPPLGPGPPILPPIPPITPPRTINPKILPELPGPPAAPPGAPHHPERTPPLQSQLSIDSDSDMTESSGLLQEVSVFLPNRPHPLIIFMIGGPGSGKGSQTAKLACCYGLRTISLDELLRRQLLSHASSDRKWEVIAEIIANGELTPHSTAIKELKRQMIGQQEARGFIVDGFPRDINQALSFQEQIGSPDLVVLLVCSSQTLSCRLERRAAQRGRLDDSSHALRRRLETFHQNILAITRYYQHQDLLRQIDADREEDVVFADLSLAVREKLFPVDQSGID